MTNNVNRVQLVQSREFIPRDEAFEAASVVFEEFASYIWLADELLKLSHVAQSGFDQSRFAQTFSPEAIDHLATRQHINTRLGRIPTGLLVRAQVAVNMIVSDGDDEGHLQEPFVGEIIIPALHQDYIRQLEQQRLSEELDFGRIR